MDVGPLLSAPQTAPNTDARSSSDAARNDDDSFSSRLASETQDRTPVKRAQHEDEARKDDDEDEDDKRKPEAAVASYSLSTPVAPVIVRLDDQPAQQTIVIDALSTSGIGRGGTAQTNQPPDAALQAAALDGAQANGAETKAGAASGHKDTKSGKGNGEGAATNADAAKDAFAALKPSQNAQQSSPSAPQPPAVQALAAERRDEAKSSEPAPAAPGAVAEAAPSPIETRRLSEALAASVHRPPTIAATVAQHVIRRFNGESTSIELRLDPAELGRVHVKLDVGADQRVTAIVAADNPATLSDLMRSSRELERALQSAGLELASGGLSFDLSQNSADTRDGSGRSAASNAGATPVDSAANSNIPAAPAARPFGLETWRGVRVDMTV